MRHSLNIIYDGQCPFCSAYVCRARLQELADVTLTNAREALIIDTQGKPAFGPLPLYIPDALRNLARFSTWRSLIEQSAVAITFLAPASTWL